RHDAGHGPRDEDVGAPVTAVVVDATGLGQRAVAVAREDRNRLATADVDGLAARADSDRRGAGEAESVGAAAAAGLAPAPRRAVRLPELLRIGVFHDDRHGIATRGRDIDVAAHRADIHRREKAVADEALTARTAVADAAGGGVAVDLELEEP